MLRIRKFIKKRGNWPVVGIALVMALALVLGAGTASAVDPRPCPNASDPPASDAVNGTIVLKLASAMGNDTYPADLNIWNPQPLPGDSGGVLWDYFPSDQASGTGVFNTYLAVKAPGKDPLHEKGYNTALKPAKCSDYDEDDSKTSALPLSAVPVVMLNGTLYREFACDINEVSGIPSQYVSLEVLQIWQTNSTNVCGTYDMGPDYKFSPAGPRLVYDLDCAKDYTLILDYGVNTGSGKPDYKVFIPNSWFDQTLGYVVMVVDHGNLEFVNYVKNQPYPFEGYGCSDGFEEWGVRIVETASKSGVKFEDLDADGAAREAGEPGLAGWTIFVDYDNDGVLDAGEPSAVTAADGSYTITGINPGTWNVTEVLQAGWNQSYPASGYYEETFEGDMSYAGNDFGNWYPASKSGIKYEDENANGQQDGGELGLGGWTIYVDIDDSGTLSAGDLSDVTASDGSYNITDIPPGTYDVREVIQAGWTCTEPNAAGVYADEVFTSSDQITDNDFGNWYPASKSGIKYEDENANGQQDGGELGLGGWTIYVDIDDSGTLTGPDKSDVTASDGSYNITDIPPGTYDVREVIQAGWTCTEPNAAGVYADEVFTSSDQITDNDFGNYEPLCWDDETAWAYGGADRAEKNWDYTDSNNWGWTNNITSEGSYVWDLYAGAGQNILSKGTVVGTVSVNYTGGCVNVTYSVDPGYYLGETHLWVGNDPLPQVTRGGRTVYTDAPGQFPYGVDYGFNASDSGTWETEWTWSSCDSDIEFEGLIYVAAHGVVWMQVECEEVNTYSMTATESDDQLDLWSAFRRTRHHGRIW